MEEIPGEGLSTKNASCIVIWNGQWLHRLDLVPSIAAQFDEHQWLVDSPLRHMLSLSRWGSRPQLHRTFSLCALVLSSIGLTYKMRVGR